MFIIIIRKIIKNDNKKKSKKKLYNRIVRKSTAGAVATDGLTPVFRVEENMKPIVN